MADASVDCVIVGGGIGGAVLALALGRWGFRIAVLEREATPPRAGRPEVLAQLTLEIFHRLGVGSRILREAAVALQGLEVWEAGEGRLIQIGHEDLERVGAQPYSTDPARTRELLLEAAVATGRVELHRGIEVQDVLREGVRIAGVRAARNGTILQFRASLVIGDDGVSSRIRSAMGIPIAIREFPMEFLAAAGPRLPGQSEHMGQVWLNPRGLKNGIVGAVFMPLPAQRTALVFILSSASCTRFQKDPPAQFYRAAADLSPLCERLSEFHEFPKGFGRFQRPFGHAKSYVRHGAALLGDAVHPVTPVGGQGANMSVADAAVLANVAAGALRRQDYSESRLRLYQTLRWRANHRSIQFSVNANRIFRMLQAAPWLAPVVPRYLKRIIRNQANRDRFLRAVSRTFASQ